MQGKGRFTILDAETAEVSFFTSGNRFETERNARVEFKIWLGKNPNDKDVTLKFGYYNWQVWYLSEGGMPIVMEEQLSASPAEVKNIPEKDRSFMLFGVKADLSAPLEVPNARYKTEGLALNALLDYIHDTEKALSDFLMGAVLYDVREVTLPDAPVLKATQTEFFKRFAKDDKVGSTAIVVQHVSPPKDKKKGKDKGGKSATPKAAYAPAPPCHTGNRPILTLGEHTLYAGGWSHQAHPLPGMVVIDLANTTAYNEYGQGAMASQRIGTLFNSFVKATSQPKPDGWLHFPLGDYQVPKLTKAQWEALAKDIGHALKEHDVLAFCQGGHGRTGMVMSIVSYMLVSSKTWEGEKPEGLLDDPVVWLRKHYCKEAVDTKLQHQYVYDILGLDIDAAPFYPVKQTTYAASPNQSGTSGVGGGSTSNAQTFLPCPRCKIQSSLVPLYGLCSSCQNLYRKEMEEKHVTHLRCDLDGHTGKYGRACSGTRIGKCGHVVHDQTWSGDQLCDDCFSKPEVREKQYTTTSSQSPLLGQ